MYCRTGIDFKDIRTYLASRYPNVELEYAESWGNLGPDKSLNLKDFSDRLIQQLKAEGFDVIEIIQPEPLVTLTIFHDKLQSNSVKINKVTARLIFPTYLNSILVNGMAFIPSYSYWADNQKNQMAAAKYKSAGYKVQQLPSDFIILQGGTIHCIAKEIN